MDNNSFKKHTKQQLIDLISQLTDALKRERADALNSRQQFDRQKLLLEDSTRLDTLVKLLPIVDNLYRAFNSIPDELTDNSWAKGVIQLRQQLNTQLSALNIKAIETINKPFDPQYMEAVAVVKDDAQKSQIVIEEITKGYLYNDKILRIAQVKVTQ